MTPRHRKPRRWRALLVVVAVAALVGGGMLWTRRATKPAPGAGVGTVVARLVQHSQVPRDRAVYAGAGTWVDGFDFGPAYKGSAPTPPVAPRDVDAMAANGVKTIFLQAVRQDARSPDGIVDQALVAEFLIRAHRHGMRVVGWYLPSFVDTSLDLLRLEQIVNFNVLGHRFDGVAVDIEDVKDVVDVNDRNQRLIDLSTSLRNVSGTSAMGAIVLPPVLTEVVNTKYWPDFPYSDLEPLYDVWLPMSYWTFRSVSSGYHDGYTYNDESVRRLRNDLANPTASVHAIGGIGDTVTPDELDGFARSLADDGAVGGSIYDWNSMTPASRAAFAATFATGPAAHLAAPP